MSKNNENKEVEEERRYKAPALAKGLDILELLAHENSPLTSSQMASKLGRSISELFRMVITLEERGYIVQEKEGYTLTNKLFSLGLAQSHIRNLIDASLSEMKALAKKVGQSCHLTVRSNDQIVVVSRIENPRDLGFSVRIGYRRPIVESSSGAILSAFLPESERLELISSLIGENSERVETDFHERVAMALKQGYIIRASDFVEGVTDISVPVYRNDSVVAALTVPHVHCVPVVCSIDETRRAVLESSKNISYILQGKIDK